MRASIPCASLVSLLALASGCTRCGDARTSAIAPPRSAAPSAASATSAAIGGGPRAIAPRPFEELDFEEAKRARGRLVDMLVARDVLRTDRVIAAMRSVPRHLFLPASPLAVSIEAAYADMPLPIGHGQTISQPAVVAMMTEALGVGATDTVLEIGTGSGWQAAILSELAAEVFTIEIVPELAAEARERLAKLGYDRVHVRAGDGFLGWPEHAPFQRIMLTAAPPTIPPALTAQLADGGVLVAPVGEAWGIQELVRVRKRGASLLEEHLAYVRFVPMIPGP